MSTVVDIDQLTSSELEELAALRRQAERQADDRRLEVLAAVHARPALGWYRRRTRIAGWT